MSNITTITSPQQLQELVRDNEVVVVDFWAEWCGPCRAIAPHFATLASSLASPSRLAFAKVNSDENPAYPPRSSKVLAELVGRVAVWSAVRQKARAAEERFKAKGIPAGQSDVTAEVDLRGLDLLNADGAFGGARALFSADAPAASKDGKESKDWVESDTDSQLMLFVPFTSTLKIRSLHITSLAAAEPDDEDTPARPKTIKGVYEPRAQLGLRGGLGPAGDAGGGADVRVVGRRGHGKGGAAIRQVPECREPGGAQICRCERSTVLATDTCNARLVTEHPQLATRYSLQASTSEPDSHERSQSPPKHTDLLPALSRRNFHTAVSAKPGLLKTSCPSHNQRLRQIIVSRFFCKHQHSARHIKSPHTRISPSSLSCGGATTTSCCRVPFKHNAVGRTVSVAPQREYIAHSAPAKCRSAFVSGHAVRVPGKERVVRVSPWAGLGLNSCFLLRGVELRNGGGGGACDEVSGGVKWRLVGVWWCEVGRSSEHEELRWRCWRRF
ncbi:hypothetical protein MRB53_041812 [Persea americana]|nr:hypothetical protein MRB53_041812 [Persea americana]